MGVVDSARLRFCCYCLGLVCFRVLLVALMIALLFVCCYRLCGFV